MKKISSLALVAVLSTACTPLINSISSSGSANYEVQWAGTTGSKLFGSYVIASKNPSTPSKVEKITTTLPYKVNFSASKNALISAAGATLNQGTVEIKIFRDGSECGKVTVMGSGAMANKTCQ
ncbi:MAG: hypothetical protein V7K25_12110 [Nostoc sp.]|uniref:hypothetical protein n=1 Tax=Nostoc sp. TaxID=1180 RepID=UPI002FF7BE9C